MLAATGIFPRLRGEPGWFSLSLSCSSSATPRGPSSAVASPLPRPDPVSSCFRALGDLPTGRAGDAALLRSACSAADGDLDGGEDSIGFRSTLRDREGGKRRVQWWRQSGHQHAAVLTTV